MHAFIGANFLTLCNNTSEFQCGIFISINEKGFLINLDPLHAFWGVVPSPISHHIYDIPIHTLLYGVGIENF